MYSIRILFPSTPKPFALLPSFDCRDSVGAASFMHTIARVQFEPQLQPWGNLSFSMLRASHFARWFITYDFHHLPSFDSGRDRQLKHW
jgi:hypothetical protein